jgi:hypothetical protein
LTPVRQGPVARSYLSFETDEPSSPMPSELRPRPAMIHLEPPSKRLQAQIFLESGAEEKMRDRPAATGPAHGVEGSLERLIRAPIRRREGDRWQLSVTAPPCDSRRRAGLGARPLRTDGDAWSLPGPTRGSTARSSRAGSWAGRALRMLKEQSASLLAGVLHLQKTTYSIDAFWRGQDRGGRMLLEVASRRPGARIRSCSAGRCDEAHSGCPRARGGGPDD